MSQQSIAALPERDLSGGRTKVTSPYGPRGGGTHYGTDQGSDDGIEIGTPIHARLDGKVVHYQYDGPFRPPNGHTAGHNIWFLADNGRRFKKFHLMGQPIVPIGLWVPQGTPIALVGNSGTGVGAYNAHLHEEEHEGSWSNPINGTPDVQACYQQRRFANTTLPPIGSEGDGDPMTEADLQRLEAHITKEAEKSRVYLAANDVASREWIVSTLSAESDEDRAAALKALADQEETTRRWLADRIKGVPEN